MSVLKDSSHLGAYPLTLIALIPEELYCGSGGGVRVHGEPVNYDKSHLALKLVLSQRSLALQVSHMQQGTPLAPVTAGLILPGGHGLSALALVSSVMNELLPFSQGEQ